MTPRVRQAAEAAVGGVQAPALHTSAVSGTENVGAGASTSTSLTPSVPLTKLLRGGGLTTALLLLALTTAGATPLCNSATSSTTASAASATSSASATTAAATAAAASTAAADTSTSTTTPTTTPTPSTASTTTSTAPATPTSSPAPLAPASAAAPARGRRSTDRLETTEVGRSSRSNRGQEGGGGTPLKDREIPTQSNSVECGIHVCMYLHALVSCGFTIVKLWMTFDGQRSHTYRRQLREELSLHSTDDLVVRLFGEGAEVPLQPLPQLGEFGALVFPKEDEVRTDLARQSDMVTRMELGGCVWTGVSWCPRGRKWGVKMVCGSRTGKQIRLGAYYVEDDVAYAYAAAAYVIRRKDHIPHMKVLTDTEMAALDGCVRSDVRHLVKVRLWWRSQWRTAIAEVGIAPGTPFSLENGGSRSPANSNGDDEGEYPLTLKEDAVDEEMQEPELE
ncbi:unnamed protein product [Closterium sp. NIES-54]